MGEGAVWADVTLKGKVGGVEEEVWAADVEREGGKAAVEGSVGGG